MPAPLHPRFLLRNRRSEVRILSGALGGSLREAAETGEIQGKRLSPPAWCCGRTRRGRAASCELSWRLWSQIGRMCRGPLAARAPFGLSVSAAAQWSLHARTEPRPYLSSATADVAAA